MVDEIVLNIVLVVALVSLICTIIYMRKSLRQFLNKKIKRFTVVIGDKMKVHPSGRISGESVGKDKEKDVPIFNNLLKIYQKNERLFAILAAIAVLISLSPLFLNVLLGPSWLSQLLGSSIGILCLRLILISTFVGGLFIILVLSLFSWSFILNLSKTDLAITEKIIIVFLMILGISTIGSLSLFLCLLWFALLDPVVYFHSLILLLIDAVILIIFISLCIYSEFGKRFGDKWEHWIILGLCILEIIFAIYIVVSLVPFMSAVNDDTTRYYSSKNYTVTFEYIDIQERENVPTVVWLFKKIDSFPNGGTFDNYYAQCHWSTNYGYFVTINSDCTLVKKYSNEFIVQKCSQFNDNVTWTYDIEDYNKTKPPVIITLRIEDPNKVVKLQQLGDLSFLGGNHVNLRWNGSDSIQIENKSEKHYFNSYCS